MTPKVVWQLWILVVVFTTGLTLGGKLQKRDERCIDCDLPAVYTQPPVAPIVKCDQLLEISSRSEIGG